MEQAKNVNHGRRRLIAAIAIAVVMMLMIFFNTLVNFITGSKI